MLTARAVFGLKEVETNRYSAENEGLAGGTWQALWFEATAVCRGSPHSSVSRESACKVGDLGSIPRSGRSPEEENGNPLQDSCLGNPMDRRAWQAAVHGVTRVGHDLLTKPPPAVCRHHIGTQRICRLQDFPGGPVVKNPPSKAGNVGSIPGN